MQFKIDSNLSDFEKEKGGFLNFLLTLKRLNKFERTDEIDAFFSKQPSYALKYVKRILIKKKYNEEKKCIEYIDSEKNRLSPENEKVFYKNIKYSIDYLYITNQKSFRDTKTNYLFERRLWRIVSQEPRILYDYAKFVLKGRLTEDKEILGIEDPSFLFYYSRDILNGKFEEKIHKSILLQTFNDKIKKRPDYDLLKAYIAQDFTKGRMNYSYYKYPY